MRNYCVRAGSRSMTCTCCSDRLRGRVVLSLLFPGPSPGLGCTTRLRASERQTRTHHGYRVMVHLGSGPWSGSTFGPTPVYRHQRFHHFCPTSCPCHLVADASAGYDRRRCDSGSCWPVNTRGRARRIRAIHSARSREASTAAPGHQAMMCRNFVQLFIQVEDVDAMIAKATSAGAKVLVPKSALPDGDTMAVLLDPPRDVVCVMARRADSNH